MYICLKFKKSYHFGIETTMEKHLINTTVRNPFAEGKDEKTVWKELLQNSKPLKKEEFLKKVGKNL